MTRNMAHQAFAQIHEIIKADKGRFHPTIQNSAAWRGVFNFPP